jgi:protein O-mannosyl-transferase
VPSRPTPDRASRRRSGSHSPSERGPRASAGRRHLAAGLVLGLAALGAYANSFDAGFAVDNKPIILEAARVHEASWRNFRDVLSSDYWAPGGAVGEYRPLATLSYMLNWAVLGNADRPLGYHVVNLLLHWLNALLVYALGLRVLRLAAVTAFFVALLFVTHPVATEAVTNIVGRADELSAASVLGCLLLYAAAREATARRRTALLVALGATAFLGFVSKESAVVVVGALALYELTFGLPRETPASGSDVLRALWRLTRTAGPALAPALAVVGIVRLWIFEREPPVRLGLPRAWLLGADLATASLTELKAFGRSLWVILWPATLCPDYTSDEIPRFAWQLEGWQDWQALVSGLVIALACVAAVRLRRRQPAATFFVGLFLAALLPILALLVVVGGVVAERLLYLPLVGFAGCVVLAAEASSRAVIDRLDRARPGGRVAGLDPRAPAWLALAAIALAYGVRTAERNRDWRDDLTLFTDAVASCAASYKSHHSLAGAVAGALGAGDLRHGTIDRVIELQETAVGILERSAPAGASIPPDVLEAQGSFYLGKALLEAGRETSAGGTDRTASAAWAAKAADALANAAEQFEGENARRRERAAGRGREVREVGTTALYNDLGLALLLSAQPARSVDAFSRARALAPQDSEAYVHLADAFAALAQPERAFESALEAVLVEPGRDDVRAAAYRAYQVVEPGGCAFSVDTGGRARFVAGCPSARQQACRAYSRLVARLPAAPNLTGEERNAIAARWRAGAERSLRCSELGHPDLRP